MAYDGLEPSDLVGEERELARRIFGDIETIPAAARSVLVAVCGRRGGKTRFLIAVRLVHGMFTRNLKAANIGPGQIPIALVVAPNEELRQESVNYALGALQDSPLASTLVLPKGAKPGDVVSQFNVRRPDGFVVGFRAGVATAGGYGGRGRSLTDFAMDESAFFRSNTFKVNDETIYRAAKPGILEGGQAIVASTPWAKAGLLYDFWARNMGTPKDAMVAHAPTTLLNDAPWLAKVVADEYVRDPDNAARELGAEFLAMGTLLFFEGDLIERARAMPCPIASPADLRPGDVVVAGGDAGFRSDSSAIAIVVRRGDMLHVVDLVELRPDAGMPLEPGYVVERFAETMRRWGARYLMADGHYRESITEHLKRHQLSYVPAPSTPSEPYVRTRVLLRESRLTLPDEPRLVQQMREVQGKPQSGGGLTITHPRWATGGHGDLCAALVLAVDQAGGVTVKKADPPKGTPEFDAREREERRREVREKNSGKPGDRGKSAYWRKTG